ncbi:hypothetical protein HRR90_008324 [Exophiala dermatitidis]|uniref:Uncharacterized protein n=1 Tax=Exophiala dermatitidis TaxID=5970 RepID=A0AAN6EJC7_EXODE|nr:hypothetical protein HRR74_003442 [Exophiala dermatitidis]KAJ4566229.1 hypothetical protein HRR79_005245 [Exophiala dermatitidis]KAJ4602849.1 hypothetical protein HRR84_002610 [Exophiala dermatitidis]KAJ4629108.1 hypothetical protein HRR88_003038 [Exophiala dermatitidis]KAJ4642598.1 hypothetical protein HRR90_008324 [Exophiala dermatitidis]
MGKIEISTAEDVDNCGREFSKFSRTLRKGDFDLEECEDMLLDAVDYGLALVRYCHELQSKHASKRPRDEVITISDSGGAALTSNIPDVAVSKKRARRNSTDSEGEDISKPSKKVRMNTTKKRTRNMMEDSSDDGQTGSSSKKARLGGQKVEAAKVFKELDALLKTTVKGPK